MKEDLIKYLEEKGYLPDEAKHTVESSWWLVELFIKVSEDKLKAN